MKLPCGFVLALGHSNHYQKTNVINKGTKQSPTSVVTGSKLGRHIIDFSSTWAVHLFSTSDTGVEEKTFGIALRPGAYLFHWES